MPPSLRYQTVVIGKVCLLTIEGGRIERRLAEGWELCILWLHIIGSHQIAINCYCGWIKCILELHQFKGGRSE